MRSLTVFLALIISFTSLAEGVIANRIELNQSNAQELGVVFSIESGQCDENTPLLEVRPRWEFRESMLSGAFLSVSNGETTLMRGNVLTSQDPENSEKGLIMFCLNESVYTDTRLVLFYSKDGHTTEEVSIKDFSKVLE